EREAQQAEDEFAIEALKKILTFHYRSIPTGSRRNIHLHNSEIDRLVSALPTKEYGAQNIKRHLLITNLLSNTSTEKTRENIIKHKVFHEYQTHRTIFVTRFYTRNTYNNNS